MVIFSKIEVCDIHCGKMICNEHIYKTITIRCSDRVMNDNENEKIIKIDRSGRRFGKFKCINKYSKRLGDMTEKEALMGGYKCKKDYIRDQIEVFNKGVTEDSIMWFYEIELIEETRMTKKEIEELFNNK